MTNSSLRLKSSYFEKKSLFRKKNTPQEVAVWVESDEDVRFWKKILKDTDEFLFHVKACRKRNNGTASDGCSEVLSLISNGNLVLGKNLIVCIDSDYRFITSEKTTNFLFETRVHSKESILVINNYPDEAITQSTNLSLSKSKFFSSALMNKISELISETFEFFIFSQFKSIEDNEFITYPQIIKENLRNISDETIYSVGEMEKTRSFIDFSKIMEEKKYIFNEKIQNNGLMNEFVAFKNVKNKFFDLKFIPLFVRGHDIFDFIVKFATKLCEKMLEIEKKSILSSEIPEDEKTRRIGQIFNKRISYKNCLELSSINYQEIPFFSDTIRSIENIYNMKI